MSGDRKTPTTTTGGASDVDAFLGELRARPVRAQEARARLLFALDATGSRQPTWEQAAHLQSEMFLAAAGIGGLKVQVCFYRGYGEFRASPWVAGPEPLLRLMGSVGCRAGETQIVKVLQHAVNESLRQRVSALAFVGDCVEEPIDTLAGRAGELGALGVPAFMFHEGDDPRAAVAFREIARLTGGAYFRFDADSADVLRDLLRAVAVYAAGGRSAMALLAAPSVRLLADQMRRR